MTVADILLQDYEVEAKNTRTTLERIPAHLADFKPHEKSMPMGRLAMHVATLPKFHGNANLRFVIPSEAEGSAVRLSPKQRPLQASSQLLSDGLILTNL